jgi:hypothetical protein
MAVRSIDARALIELAIATLRQELAPALPSDKRYAAAMVANALEIARREVMADGDAARWELLDAVYEEGQGTLRQLAADIRDGSLDEDELPDLGKRLEQLLEAELRVTNPGFLSPRTNEPPGRR